MGQFNFIEQKKVKDFNAKGSIEYFTEEAITKALNFQRSFEAFADTNLVMLGDFAKNIGLDMIYLKDESTRFGINSFKGLGASWAMGNIIAEKLGISIDELSYQKMISDEVREKLGDVTFISCTDGNHGRGVAWVGKMLKQKVMIYMPKGTAQERFDNIAALGAYVEITDLNYDDTTRFVKDLAEEKGYVIVQDTSWEGYVDIPKWIMQGYASMALEAYLQITNNNLKKPTHIFIQAGVGAMAGGVCGLFTNIYKEELPKMIIVEPNNAACYYKSIKADDGKIHFVGGDMDTIMAGLACGEPGTIAWDVLGMYADASITCPDWVTANGMRMLASPMGKDQRVTSGESGAVSFGLTNEIMNNPELAHVKETLGFDENSVVLCFSTEGDTFKEEYRDIVWYGKFSKYYG